MVFGGCSGEVDIGGKTLASREAILSDESSLGDTTSNTSEPQFEVIFPGHNLERVIRNIIQKPEGAIYNTDLSNIVAIEAYHQNISNLSGIEYCVNVKEIYLSYNNITDLTPLSQLKGGQAGSGDNAYTTLHISLVENPVSDLIPLSNLTVPDELTLVLDRIGASNISPLSGLPNLICLYASEDHIQTIPQNEWSKLSILSLWGNDISDVSPLSEHTGRFRGATKHRNCKVACDKNLLGPIVILQVDDRKCIYFEVGFVAPGQVAIVFHDVHHISGGQNHDLR